MSGRYTIWIRKVGKGRNYIWRVIDDSWDGTFNAMQKLGETIGGNRAKALADAKQWVRRHKPHLIEYVRTKEPK